MYVGVTSEKNIYAQRFSKMGLDGGHFGVYSKNTIKYSTIRSFPYMKIPQMGDNTRVPDT